MLLVFSGFRYKEGKIWFEELYDKFEFVVIYFYWVIKNCNGDFSILRLMLENCVEYYKGNYKQCYLELRCKKDFNYELFKIVIQNLVVEKLLRNVIINLLIYKYFEDFKLGCDIYYVESFNNILNIYEDKRIVFGSDQYKVWVFLGICYWNENVGRDFILVFYKSDFKVLRRKVGKKNYKK